MTTHAANADTAQSSRQSSHASQASLYTSIVGKAKRADLAEAERDALKAERDALKATLAAATAITTLTHAVEMRLLPPRAIIIPNDPVGIVSAPAIRVQSGHFLIAGETGTFTADTLITMCPEWVRVDQIRTPMR